ncbi:hypothetical protein H6F77_11710 [Microcoleus sp. FACHB-831]|uniref:hypothetical protein n=1 Tax=Microcoleus sp. FACHB-831 TaxID=2692827 RepID=UPI001681E772|nr:hypothetical protein [Microcoleus sp. FACHB-831]MBD1921758.1 hypothetical protein [Microcoleus sp. FACHB-831]
MSPKITTTQTEQFAIIEIKSEFSLSPEEIVSLYRPKLKKTLGVIIDGQIEATTGAFLASIYRQQDWIALRDYTVNEPRYMVIKGNRSGISPGDLFTLDSESLGSPVIAWIADQLV